MRRRPWAAVILVMIGLPLVVLLLLFAMRSETSPPASRSSPAAAASATATTAATPQPAANVSPSAAACANAYLVQGPIVAPRKAGQHLEVALDFVGPGPTRDDSRWGVRFFVPATAPRAAVVPLNARVSGPNGSLPVGAFEYGPPNAGTLPASQPVAVEPCDAAAPPGIERGTIVVVFQSARVTSGAYTLTWREIRLPEGGTRDETWTVTLNCDSSGACR